MEHHLSLDAGVGVAKKSVSPSMETRPGPNATASASILEGLRALPGPDVPDVAGPNICIAQIEGWKFRVVDIRDGSFVDP
jgi:hypothetical protein